MTLSKETDIQRLIVSPLVIKPPFSGFDLIFDNVQVIDRAEGQRAGPIARQKKRVTRKFGCYRTRKGKTVVILETSALIYAYKCGCGRFPTARAGGQQPLCPRARIYSGFWHNGTSGTIGICIEGIRGPDSEHT